MKAEKSDIEWVGKALIKLLNKSPVDGPDRFLRLLQEWNSPFDVLELINALTFAGVAVTITQRFSYLQGKEVKANNLKKARLAKVSKKRVSKKSGKNE